MPGPHLCDALEALRQAAERLKNVSETGAAGSHCNCS